MNFNDVQKKLGEINSKLNSLGIITFFDEDYSYKIKYKDRQYSINFIGNIDDYNKDKDDNTINICINQNIYATDDIIYEEDLNELLRIKEVINSKVFIMIRDYVFFNKNNKDLFNIISSLSGMKEVCAQEEKKEIKKTEIGSSTTELTENDIIELLNNDFDRKYTFKHINNPNLKKYFFSSDNKIAVLSLISKRYDRSSYKYWYTFHTNQKEELDKYSDSYIMFYFTDKREYVLMNTKKLYQYLTKLGKTQNGDNIGWHIHIQEQDGKYQIRLPKEGLYDIDEIEELQELNAEEKQEVVIDLSTGDFRVIKY